MNTQTLELRFKTNLDRAVTIRVDDPVDGLTAQTISAVMDTLIARNVFAGSATTLVSKVDARIVSRAVETMAVV